MTRLKVLGRGFPMFEQIVRRFDGIWAATQLWNTASRMDSHRLGDLLDACDAPDIGQLRPCKLGLCPSLWFLVHTTLQCITPYLLLAKPLYFTMPQQEFWVMTSVGDWCDQPLSQCGELCLVLPLC